MIEILIVFILRKLSTSLHSRSQPHYLGTDFLRRQFIRCIETLKVLVNFEYQNQILNQPNSIQL